MCIIRRHFLACEDIAGGSEMSAAVTFFREILRPFQWVPDVRWTNHYFARNKEAISLRAAVDPAVGLSTYSPLQMHVGR